MRPIKVGQIEKDMALIEDGLQPGEKVVVDGQYKLQRGSKVKLSGEKQGKAGSGRPGATGDRKPGSTGKPPRENSTEGAP
jgi:multidrug efflux system membrane fusion protein